MGTALVAQSTSEPASEHGVTEALLIDDQCAGDEEKQEHCGLNALQRATESVESEKDVAAEQFMCGVIYCDPATSACCKSGNGMDSICIAKESTCCRSRNGLMAVGC